MAEYIDRAEAISGLRQLVVDHSTDIFDGQLLHYTGIKGMLECVPTADVQPVTHCKDCVYRPYYEPPDSKSVSDLVFPDYRFNPCPCRVEDVWYSWMPDDDWFCAYGKRMDGES